MVRVKTPLKLIEGEKHRNTTFMKRRVVIKKKTMELSKLCDIATLLVCYGPRGQLETWPEEPQQARHIIDHYRSALRGEDCVTRRYDVATFFEGHLKKLQADLDRQRTAWLEGTEPECLETLAKTLDLKLAAIDMRLGHTSCVVEEEEEEEGEKVVVGRRGKEIEQAVWWEPPAEASAEGLRGGYCPLSGSLPLSDGVLDVQPLQSLQGFPWRIVTENFRAGDPPSELYPQLFGGPSPLGAKLELQQPVQSSEGLDFHSTMLEELTRSGNVQQGLTGAASWAASAIEMPHVRSLPTMGQFMLPPIPEPADFGAEMGYLDHDAFFSGALLGMNFSSHPFDAGACSSTSSAADALNPTTTACGGGGAAMFREYWNAPSFEQPTMNTGHGLPLCHLLASGDPAVSACSLPLMYPQNELHGVDGLLHGGRSDITAGSSTTLPPDTVFWPSPGFLEDLPPAAGCSGAGDSLMAAAALGRDDRPKFMPTPRGRREPL